MTATQFRNHFIVIISVLFIACESSSPPASIADGLVSDSIADTSSGIHQDAASRAVVNAPLNTRTPSLCGNSCVVAGDVVVDGQVSVLDVQCEVLALLSELAGQTPPGCVTGTTDANCDGALDITDATVTIHLAIGESLDSSIDQNHNGCPDLCETTPDPTCAPERSPERSPKQSWFEAAAACTGPELPDDGVDSDCDGFEYFGSAANNLALSGPIGTPTFNVTVSGTFQMGLFGAVTVTGTLTKTAPAAPVIWCVTGTSTMTVGPVVFNGTTLKVCRLANGTISNTLTGQITVAGAQVTTTGTFSTTAPLVVTCSINALPLDTGITLQTVTLDLADGISTAELSADLAIGNTNQKLFLNVSGDLPASGNVILDLVQPADKPWTPFGGGFNLTLNNTTGDLSRSGADWTVTIAGNTPSVTVAPGFVLSSASFSATFAPNSTWNVTFTGGAQLGPFTASLTGSLTQATPIAPVTGCFTGTTTATILGVSYQNVQVTACRKSDGTANISLSGIIGFEGQDTEFAGVLTVPSPWTLTLVVDDVEIVPNIIALDNLSLSLTESGTEYNLIADLNLGAGATEFSVVGTYKKVGELHLTITLQPGKSWSPMTGVDFAATSATGTLDRVNNKWTATVTVAASAANVGPLSLSTVTGTAVIAAQGVNLGLSGTAKLDPFTVTLTGTLNLPTGGQITGCFGGSLTSQSVLGISFPTLSFQTCPAEGKPLTVTVTGSMVFEGKTVTIAGTLTPGSPYSFVIAAQNVQLAPGFVFDVLTLTITSSGISLVGDMTIGTGDAALPLRLTGVYVSDGPITLSVALQPGETWNVLPSLGIEVEQLSGTFGFDDGDVTLSVSTIVGLNLTLVPGLVLKNAGVAAALDTNGNMAVTLSGTIQITIGSTTFNIAVSGTVEPNAFKLQGGYDGTILPLNSLVGDLFKLVDPTLTFTIDSNAGTYSISVSSTAKICIFAPCSPAEYLEFGIEGGIITGSGAGVYFIGDLPDITIPTLGNVDLIVAATTVELDSYDLLNTPLKPSDDVDIPTGITLFTLAPLPVPIGGISEEILFAISVSPSTVNISATIPFDWVIIDEDTGFTGIDSLVFDSMTVGGELTPGSVEFFISSQATLQPSTQESPLVGTASFAIGFGTVGVSFTITSNVVGRWYDPLGIQKFAIQNPGFEIGITYSGQIPVPKSFGFTGDVYWLDTLNNWPSELAWAVPQSYPAPPPPNGITLFGGTIYFDLEPTPSGLCILGACLPLPTFIFRLEIANFSFPGTFIDLSIDLFDTLQSYLPNALPTVPLPDLNLSSVGIDVNHFLVYASTHDTEVFGVDFQSGFLADIDVDIFGTQFTLHGFADTAGLYLEAAVEPFDFLGLGIFQIVGDPFRQICELGGGSIEVNHAAALNLTSGTIEALVRDNSFGTDPFSSVIVSKDDGKNGYTIGIGDAVSGKAKVSARFRKDGLERIFTTEHGVVPSGVWTNVSVVFDGNNIAIFVDGTKKSVLNTKKEFSGGAGTNAAKLTMGTGLTRIDDIRIWKTKRTQAEINGEKHFLKQSSVSDLTLSYTGDPDLIARYEFDYDSGTKAHNTRHYETGAALHGDVVGGAQINNSLVNNDLFFKLALRVPGSKGSEDGPGLWFQAGFILDLPILGNIEAATQVQISTSSIFGSLYIKEFTLLPTPLGDFVIGGYGPDFVPDNFDDGLFGFVDLLDVSFGMTAEVAFTGAKGNDVVSTGGSVLFACPPTGACTNAFDHIFQATGNIDLAIGLGGLGDFGLEGGFDILLNSADWYIDVVGTLVIFGWDFISSQFRMDGNSVEFETVWDFGEVTILGTDIDLGMLVLSMSFDFTTLDLCGSGEYSHHPEPGEGDVFDCGVSACFSPTDIDIGLGCGDFCIGPAFCTPEEFCYISICTEKLENGQTCLKDNYCKSNYCGCIADGFVSLGICFEPNSKELGEDCYANNECVSGKCTAELCIKGTCVCADDNDCAANQYCDQGFIGTIGTNSCKAKKADGEGCGGDGQCISGECSVEGEFGICGFCYTPNSKDVGASCKVDAECVTDICSSLCGIGGKCKCDVEADCEADEYCNNGTFDDHLCYPNKEDCETCDADKKCISSECSASVLGKCYEPNSKNVGQDCCVDDQCKSDKCSGGECVCQDDADCDTDDPINGIDGNEHCYTPVLGTPYCELYKDDGEGCDTDSECQSGECGGCVDDIFGINLGTCYTPNSKEYGETCYADNECESDRCSADCVFDPQGTCKCNTDNDCPSPGTQYCSGGNCYTEVGDHSYCGSDDEKCSSGNCDCEPAGRCITADNSKSAGESCYDDAECIGYCTGSCVAGTPWIGECKALKNDCVNCTSASQCKGGYCIWDGEFNLSECVTKNSLNSGQSCCSDSQCKSGNCKKNNIFTEDDNECD
ncbi:MAG: hypothetical protein HUU55_03835 [Myxococcales bacterium]|nr:hypothetical protein [Myxococcales bacterium]